MAPPGCTSTLTRPLVIFSISSAHSLKIRWKLAVAGWLDWPFRLKFCACSGGAAASNAAPSDVSSVETSVRIGLLLGFGTPLLGRAATVGPRVSPCQALWLESARGILSDVGQQRKRRFSAGLLRGDPRHRPLFRPQRPADLAFDAVPDGDHHLRGGGALRVQRPDHLCLRDEQHGQRRRVHARLRLRALQGRARAHRHLLGALLGAQEGDHRPHLLPAALLPEHDRAARDQHRRRVVLGGGRRALAGEHLPRDHVAVPLVDPARRGAVHRAGRVRGAEVRLPDPLRPRVPAPREVRGMSLNEFLGLAMLVVMLGAIFIGLPISFTLLFLALIFGFSAMEWRVFDLTYLHTLSLMKQDEFVAVPMFILMGYICDQAGLIERLFKAFRDLFAPMRGALYVVVILTATLFGIAAGTVGATVTLIGIMAGPLMIKAGYDARMSAGALAAGGTLGILIPPSVMLVVMAPVLDISIIDL